MKLSEIKGERTIDVIAEIIEPIANIAADKNASKLFKKQQLKEGQNARKVAIERLTKCVPPLLKNHKADVIAILAAINGVTPAEYSEGLNMAKLMQDAVDLITDSEFLALFQSAV